MLCARGLKVSDRADYLARSVFLRLSVLRLSHRNIVDDEEFAFASLTLLSRHEHCVKHRRRSDASFLSAIRTLHSFPLAFVSPEPSSKVNLRNQRISLKISGHFVFSVTLRASTSRHSP